MSQKRFMNMSPLSTRPETQGELMCSFPMTFMRNLAEAG